MNPDTNIYISNSYVSKMTIRVVGSEIYFSFSDGSYRRISLETSNVKDVSRLLRSDGYLEDGQLDRGRRITNYYKLTDVNKPIWHLLSENKAVYDDYLLFAESIKFEDAETGLVKPKDINRSLLQSKIDGYSGSSAELASCTLEKSLLDYGYDGHATWDDCSGLSRVGFIGATVVVLQCFIPVWNVLTCAPSALGLVLATANMFSTGDHCSATYERAQINYNVCMQNSEPKSDPNKDEGRDDPKADGTFEGGGVRCGRWQRVQKHWGGLYGSDAGGSWDSYEICVEWIRY